jgi:hypothetical protein
MGRLGGGWVEFYRVAEGILAEDLLTTGSSTISSRKGAMNLLDACARCRARMYHPCPQRANPKRNGAPPREVAGQFEIEGTLGPPALTPSTERR